jgi:predicted alpha/beta hydrolase family esterase
MSENEKNFFIQIQRGIRITLLTGVIGAFFLTLFGIFFDVPVTKVLTGTVIISFVLAFGLKKVFWRQPPKLAPSSLNNSMVTMMSPPITGIGLKKVSNYDKTDRIGDVIFVHGLDGDAQATWQAEGTPENFWPAWLGQDLPNIGIWSLGYEISSLAWKGSDMPLADRATNTLVQLDVNNIGKRPLVFITHSLGGLLVKQMLRHAHDYRNPSWQLIVDQTKGIVFLSTPHSGSNIVGWIEYLGTILQTTVSVQELKAHDPRLRELNIWYRNNVSEIGIKTEVYYEKRPLYGIVVVDETSADPGIPGVIPIPMDDNHVTICKPASRESLIYVRVKRFIEDCIATSTSEQSPQEVKIQDDPKTQDDNTQILNAATDLVTALRALDNAIRLHLSELTLFKPSWSQERRDRVIKEIKDFAHREELIVRVRQSRHKLDQLRFRIKLGEEDQKLVLKILNAGTDLLGALGGFVTPFRDIDVLIEFLNCIDQAQDSQDAQNVIERSKKTLEILDREVLASLDEILGILKGRMES